MSAGYDFNDLDPSFFATLRLAVGREPINLAPTCNHAPVTCVWKSEQDHSCKIQPLRDTWQREERIYPSHDDALVRALENAGCDPCRARMVIHQEGYGMDLKASDSLIRAYRQLQDSIRHPVPKDVKVCDQCRPGTNTFALRGSSYERRCHFVPVRIASNSNIVEEGKVLCIGAGGKLRLCSKDEFMAVSHVWDHGWQGESEKGLCSRTLDLLLFVAGLFDLEWVWIDIAMISREPKSKSLAINKMNFVYTCSKVTVVFDRLLMSMDGGSDRERVMAIFLMDWMTRVWTMQEALLAKDLYFLFRDCHVRGHGLKESMIHNTPVPALHWQQWAAISTLCTMLDGYVTPMLDRIYSLAKERLTTKKEDMSRAIFPLFNLAWPGRATTLEAGQAKILQHLGTRAARLAPLHGPIMPQPWSWAPLAIPGTSGFLQPQGTERVLEPSGLHGRWAAWRILRVLGKKDLKKGYGTKLAELTGTCYDNVRFQVEGASLIFEAGVFSRPENTYPWRGQDLFLLRAHNTGTARTTDLDYYDLVVKDARPNSFDIVLYHRLGSAMGALNDGIGGRGLDVGDCLEGYIN
ncbi:hypothetical protein FOCG_17479 [Fusarium oxysporum f. sp. radicis-lycopersici 26381]|nr:hypothetical protein FOCG_17479 [Fusarium oxysporum f. sp. radicis-lycopersici 26381]